MTLTVPLPDLALEEACPGEAGEQLDSLASGELRPLRDYGR